MHQSVYKLDAGELRYHVMFAKYNDHRHVPKGMLPDINLFKVRAVMVCKVDVPDGFGNTLHTGVSCCWHTDKLNWERGRREALAKAIANLERGERVKIWKAYNKLRPLPKTRRKQQPTMSEEKARALLAASAYSLAGGL